MPLIDLDNAEIERQRLLRHELASARKAALALGEIGAVVLRAVEAAICYEGKCLGSGQ